MPGWWPKSRSATSIDGRSLAVYEALVRFWRPLEDRVRLPWGVSLIVVARKAQPLARLRIEVVQNDAVLVLSGERQSLSWPPCSVLPGSPEGEIGMEDHCLNAERS